MRHTLIIILAVALTACGSRYGGGVPAEYDSMLDEAFGSSKRGDDLKRLLADMPEEQQKAMAYLIAYMPQGDRDTMSLDLLRENVEYACKARSEFPWAKDIDEDVFLNDVLPYASVDEVRDSWRRDFYERFGRRVAGCQTLREAAEIVNRSMIDETGVEYNTLREKTNQSPSESIRQHMASCTGLSILLVDALRSVGIPARFAGTPAWHDDRGNHSWTEIFIDGKWCLAEYYYQGFDSAWFMADAGKADPNSREHGIYAASFSPTGDWFPMAWNEDSHEVHGLNVTDSYIKRYELICDSIETAGTHVGLSVRMLDRAHGADVKTSDRVEANVDIFCGSTQVGGGRTAGPHRDMNDMLTFLVEKNRIYTLKYENARGELAEVNVSVNDEPVVVDTYME